MSRVKVLCENCESEPLQACDTGEETFYRCSGAGESEIESRSGCGSVVSFQQYKKLKEAAEGAAKKSVPSVAGKNAVAKVNPLSSNSLKPSLVVNRKPLASLHANSLHQRSSLSSLNTKPASLSGTQSSKPSVTSSGSSSQNDGSQESNTEPKSPVKKAPIKSKKAVVSSTSTTPTKLSSASSSPIAKKKQSCEVICETNNNSSLSNLALNAEDRMRALKAKLKKQRLEKEREFHEMYGEDGADDTAEERAHAARKGSGEAAEEFLSSQGEIQVARAPMIGSLSVKGAENPLAVGYRKPFSTPRALGTMNAEAAKLVASKAGSTGRRLGARFRISSMGFGAFKPLEAPAEEPIAEATLPPPPVVLTKAEESKAAPDGYQPLTIWSPTPEELAANPNLTSIEVPMVVCKWLRPHQREGVKFMCECVLGQRNLTTPETSKKSQSEASPSSNMGGGAILADDMGLGKTLQSVATLYTLLTQGFEKNSPVARKVIIVTPTSLVSNWNNELEKWLGKGKVNAVALSEVGKDNIQCGIDSYIGRGSKAHVLIVSYDTFRRYIDKLNKPGFCDLLICDEAHRLKNCKTSTYEALDSLPCKRRILLSGTPMQNDLSEFFSMINFTNRNIIGDRKLFRKYFELPILIGREPDCLESEADLGSVRSSELSAIVNQFVLRRTNVLLRAHLPPKVIQVVCCRPSELQVKLYRHFLASKAIRKLTSRDDEAEEGGRRGGGGLQALPLITSLKKLCNHPKLIYDTAVAAASGKSNKIVIDEETGASEKIPPALMALFKGVLPIFQQYDGGNFVRSPADAKYGGKMFVLERLLNQIRVSNSGDRIVIVSNFTSALDVIAKMCETKKWEYLRLDGTTSIKNRQKLVDKLSDHRGNKVFVFLLSSRAGGCGLNLIGANRLILFDPDWNPAVDKQAAARVWRDGQQKRCFVYRFLTTSSIEEKVYQRQLSKEGLSGVLGGSTADASLTKDELRDLFTLDDAALEQPSDTHKGLFCDCLDHFQIRTEEEAKKAEEQQKREAEEHAKRIEKEQQEAAKRAAEEATAGGADDEEMKEDSSSSEKKEGEGSEAMNDEQPGAHAAPMNTDDNTAAEDGGEEGEGNDDGDAGEDDDEEMNDFIDDGDDDGDEEDYGGKSKKGAKNAKKPSKKDGPRKQRKQRAAIGSLNFPVLNALSACTRGQRGEPPEEELINWAHHATANSIPDPMFRIASKGMPLTRGELPYVSFVFSCEVSGKPILNSNDADVASKVSSRCDEAPTVVQASKPLVISVEQARANHHEFMRNELSKQKRRMGVDEDDDLPDPNDPSKRRHSTRSTRGSATQNKQEEEEEDDDDDDDEEMNGFIVPDEDGDNDDGAGEEGEPGGADAPKPSKSKSSDGSKKRKSAPASSDDMDPATAALIQQMMEEDSGMRRKTITKKKKQKQQQHEPAETEVDNDAAAMSDVEAEQTAPPPPKKPSTTDATASSPSKKQKTTLEQLPAPTVAAKSVPKPQVDDDRSSISSLGDKATEDDDSDVMVVEKPTPTLKPVAKKLPSPAKLKQPSPAIKPKFPVSVPSDDTDDFL